MEAFCNCCYYWWKQKPPADPPLSASTPQYIQKDSPNNHQTAGIFSTTQSQPSASSFKTPRPTWEEVISNFETIDIRGQADGFIKAIKEVLKTVQKYTRQDTPSTSSFHTDKLSNWSYIIQSGGKFLKFINDHTQKIKIDTKDSFFQSGERAKIVGNTLKQIGQVHWVVAVLSSVGYLVSKCAKVSENRTECLELLQEMITLASHIKDLNILIEEEKEKFEKAFQYIIEGSISCASQLHSGKLFSFLKSTVNSETLTAVRTKINAIYMDLNLTATRNIIRQRTLYRPMLPQVYPSDAVGIEDQVEEVIQLLNMEDMEGSSSFAIVLWGLGGIGKTTVAKAVVSAVDRDRYNYARIELDLVRAKNNYKEIQQQSLKDAFPNYECGRKLALRNDADGRDHLTQAFKNETNKPVFLFIDNALYEEDLEKILPEDLLGLPKNSRIIITTRILSVTDVLEERGLVRKDYPLKRLSHTHALTILCNDPTVRDTIKDDLQRIVKLCDGIPLVLKIVGAHLRKKEYKADRCTQILEALETGQKIKEKDLSDCLFDFVYNRLEESTQEAFLDICCFFHTNCQRQHVEYIVGAEEVASLVDAALITTVMKQKEEVLSVHDIILSIGRNMSKPSRIMDEDSWFEVEMDEAKLRRIKGLCFQSEDCVLQERHLRSMKDKLRILIWMGNIDVCTTDIVTLSELRFIITDCDISGLNVEALDKLAFLECKKLPIKCIDHLKLPNSLRSVKGEVRDLSKIVPSSSLEELYLSFSEPGESFVEERDNSENAFNRFLQCSNKLKRLHVLNCWSLCELPEQVCKLPQLGTLVMIRCYIIECLPECFGQLKTLKKLDLSECESLKELPSSFVQLTGLTHLNMGKCRSLKKLSSSFDQLTLLRELNLSWCASLSELPTTFGQLTALRELDLSGCTRLEVLPSSFDHLKTLILLNLSWCIRLIELPPTFDQLINLRDLYLSVCGSLRKLPSNFNNLKSLEYLDLTGCYNLEFDICQRDDNIKIVKKSEHNCINCHEGKKIKIIRE